MRSGRLKIERIVEIEGELHGELLNQFVMYETIL